MIKDPREYLAIADLAHRELERLLFGLYPVQERFSIITKVFATEPSEIALGHEFKDERLNEVVGALYLLRGVACFLAGEFKLAIKSLLFVSHFLKKNPEHAKLFIALSFLFLDRTEDAAYFLNLSVGVFGGDLLCILASCYLRKDFSRIKAHIERAPSEIPQLLNTDPLVFYFYAKAVYELDRLERDDKIFNLILKPIFEVRLTMGRKYLFLDPLLRKLYTQFGERVLEKPRLRREEALKVSRKAAWDKVLWALKEVESLSFDQKNEIPEEILEQLAKISTQSVKRPVPERPALNVSPTRFGQIARLSRARSQAHSEGETGGSPFAVATDAEVAGESPEA